MQLSAETVNILKIKFDKLFSGLGRTGSVCSSASHSPIFSHGSFVGKEYVCTGQRPAVFAVFIDNVETNTKQSLLSSQRAQRDSEARGAGLHYTTCMAQ